jgi:2-iminobutanoate/2-iminopropanoate deaminase
MKITQIVTDQAPAAIGPYSQAIKAGNQLFCSGQIPLLPDGTLVEGGIREQALQVMKNLKAVVEAAGADLTRVVKTTIYLTDLGDFALVNEIYGAEFSAQPPARATVQVAGLPKGVLIEIEAIAVLD